MHRVEKTFQPSYHSRMLLEKHLPFLLKRVFYIESFSFQETLHLGTSEGWENFEGNYQKVHFLSYKFKMT